MTMMKVEVERKHALGKSLLRLVDVVGDRRVFIVFHSFSLALFLFLSSETQ